MPKEKSIRSGWRCDSCGELVSDLQAGWVEWLAAEDAKGKPKVSGLRLVHRQAPGRSCDGGSGDSSLLFEMNLTGGGLGFSTLFSLHRREGAGRYHRPIDSPSHFWLNNEECDVRMGRPAHGG